MRIIKQMVLTVYEDGTTRVTERALVDRDAETGRYKSRTVVVHDATPIFPEFENYMKETR